MTETQAAPRARPPLLKSILPRTLFGRAVLILVTPLILVQAVATWVFYDRLWEAVMHRLSDGVAGEIALVIDARPLLPADVNHTRLLDLAASKTSLGFAFHEGARLPPPSPPRNSALPGPGHIISTELGIAIQEEVRRPFRIASLLGGRAYLVTIEVPNGVLDVTVPRDRLWTSTTYIFLLWMVGTALVTLAVATLFLRNQIRSLRRLAIAAEAFGKGRDVPNFRLEGAAEVRQAARAFLVMRERIQRQISQRTEMLAGVSHDLRTPLTRMKLELELLGDVEETQGLKADVAEMERMVAGYLDFVRGEGTEAPRVTDLMAVLRTVAANAQRTGAEISLSGPEELHLPLRQDAVQRAITNLVGNAARYGSHVWITVLAGRMMVDIMVDDDGPGIPETLREAVFRPFFRVEGSRNRMTGGIGLGLTIARDIARSQGGELTLDTSPHGGLRARLSLPR
jgi:two-component system osmolarity sensor histidine kinase EnvZ